MFTGLGGGVRGTSFATQRPMTAGNQNRTNLANSLLQAQRAGQSNPVPYGQQIGGENGFQPISGNVPNWTANRGGATPTNQGAINRAAQGFETGYQPSVVNNGERQGSSGNTIQPYGSGANATNNGPLASSSGGYNPWGGGQQGGGGNDSLLFRDAEISSLGSAVQGNSQGASSPVVYQGGPQIQGVNYDMTQNPYNHSSQFSQYGTSNNPYDHAQPQVTPAGGVSSSFSGVGPNNTGLPQDQNSAMRNAGGGAYNPNLGMTGGTPPIGWNQQDDPMGRQIPSGVAGGSSSNGQQSGGFVSPQLQDWLSKNPGQSISRYWEQQGNANPGSRPQYGPQVRTYR